MAAIPHFDQGDIWVPQATFTVAGTPTDPTTLVVRIKAADGTVTTITENTPAAPMLPIVRVSAGVFKHSGIALNDAGYWYVRFEGTGTVAAAEDHEAIVDPSPFYESAQLSARALVSLAEAKDWLQGRQIDTGEDLDLARVINDMSDRMHDEADREFKVYGTNPQIRLFDVLPEGPVNPWYVDGEYQGALGPRGRIVKVGDLTSFTSVRILDTDWITLVENVTPLTKVTAHPINRKPWEPIRALELRYDVSSVSAGQRLEVTGNWGFPTVPGNVRQAVLDAVAAVMDRDVEHYRQDLGITGAGAPGQNTIVIGMGRQRMLSMPPSSLAVAWAYRDPAVG
jgi:hypothetical protein